MPDLDIVPMQQCKSLNNRVYHEGGYTQTDILTPETRCTCKGFKYHKQCKHLKKLWDKVQTGEICTWHEQSSMQVQSKEQEDQMICPSCSGETEWVRVAV